MKERGERKSFNVLVSQVDNSITPVLFFPYPAYVQLKRECPIGYEGW